MIQQLVLYLVCCLDFLEATSGFEPLNKGFADLPLSHLGTSPQKPELRTQISEHRLKICVFGLGSVFCAL